MFQVSIYVFILDTSDLIRSKYLELYQEKLFENARVN